MPRTHLARIRKICLALPEAIEVEAWGAPTFRIGKIFAMYAQPDNHHGDGREGIWVKTDHFTQDLLVRAQPARYFSPPYVGPQGWTGVYLDEKTDWIATTVLIRDAYRVTAPKRLAALVADDDDAPVKPAKKAAKTPARKKPAKKPAKKAARTKVAAKKRA
jgi:hypothetical protein